MQFKQSPLAIILIIALLTLPFFTIAQTTYLNQGAKENLLLERLEIKAQTDSVLNFSKTKPFSRKQFIPRLQSHSSIMLSKVDAYNLHTAQISNIEYAPDSILASLKSKTFFKSPANFYETYSTDFHLIINPVFQYKVSKESDNSEHLFLNTRGVTLRGGIAKKIGFAAYITDNQERTPQYVQQWVREREAVPGQGYYKEFKATGYDYFDARGYITFNIAKYIDATFGYDKNFIGNGHRSLLLSDFSNNALFLKLNTRIWKFNYQNIFMELVNAHRRGLDQLLPKKYAAMHHLDLYLTPWLNVGFFETIVFGRKDHFEFGYLNPLIFYKSIEQQQGSADNTLVGLDAKANVARKFQLYGQFIIDEFRLSELNKKWWANKFGYQLGGKYIDALGISNLDLQFEWNHVRPFLYSHKDSVANYTHNNQPMAHPLGANFNEVIGVVRYQPAPKWYVEAKGIYYLQGKDTGSVSFGSNIFLPNVPPYRQREYGYEVGNGIGSKVAYTSLLLSYEWRPNLFFETQAILRKNNETILGPGKNSTIISAGIRWNMHRREFDF